MRKKSEILFIFLTFIFIFISGSLLTFSSHQLITGKGNIFGSAGIKTSDFFLQAFGYASIALLFYIALWAVMLWREEKLWIIQRTLAALFFTSSFSIIFRAYIKANGIYSPGGAVGEVFFQALSPIIGKSGLVLLSLLFIVLSLYSFSNFSLARSFSYIKNFMDFFFSKVEVGVRIPKTERAYRPVIKEKPERKKKPSKESEGRHLKKPTPELFPGENLKEIPLEFLKSPTREFQASREEIKKNSETIERKLMEFGIKGKVIKANSGPVITVYEFLPEPGVRVSFVVNMFDDLALALGVEAVRIARIPGKTTIGIEVPNKRRTTIYLREILESDEFKYSPSPLTLALGKNVDGSPFVIDLRPFPHLLIGGATGMGKSVALNSMLLSLIFKSSPDVVKFILIDPKRVEFSLYNGIPYLLTPVITSPEKAIKALEWAVREMDRRLGLLAKFRVRSLEQYRELSSNLTDEELEEYEDLPYIVIFIDELSNLMLTAPKEIEFFLTRLSQEARAPGIHLIFATQRPSTDVITGTIKNNFPARIALGVPSRHDSRTILGTDGAEKLLNKGDMLFMSPNSSLLRRVHGAYVSEEEVERIVEFLKMNASPQYRDIFRELKEVKSSSKVSLQGDDVYIKALKLVLSTGNTSATFLQRKLRIGFPKAARLLDRMEEEGILSPMDENKRRKILVDPIELLKSIEEGEL